LLLHLRIQILLQPLANKKLMQINPIESKMTRDAILVINAGSSSIKFSVFETAADRSVSAGTYGQVARIGTSARLKIVDAQGRGVEDRAVAGLDHQAAIAAIHEWFRDRAGSEAGFSGMGSLIAALGGLDALVFTGGIGENAAEIRARVCRQAHWIGIVLDDEANARGGPLISRSSSAVSAWVVPTDENLMIARHTRRLIDETAGTRIARAR
jgi:acetate kinase